MLKITNCFVLGGQLGSVGGYTGPGCTGYGGYCPPGCGTGYGGYCPPGCGKLFPPFGYSYPPPQTKPWKQTNTHAIDYVYGNETMFFFKI